MFLKILMEILLLLILVGGSYYGIIKGFFKMAAAPLKLVAGLVFSFSLCKVVGKFVIAPIIQSPVTNYIKDFMYEHCSDLTPDNVVSEMPTLLKMAGAAFNVDVAAASGTTTDEMLESVILNFTSPAVNCIGIIFAFVLLFLLSKLLISIGISLVNTYVSVGVLGKINRTMGFVLAGVLAFFGAWAFAGTVDFIFHLGIFNGSELIRNFSGGWLYRLFTSFSPIELLLSF